MVKPIVVGIFSLVVFTFFSVFVGISYAGMLVYSTYIGGSDNETNYGTVVVDSAGNAYITGWTNSPDFPTTTGAFDTTNNGDWDAIVCKLNPKGTGLVYSTCLGGSNTEWDYGIAVDNNGYAFISGFTQSTDFPITPGAFDTSYNGGDPYNWDGFVTKLNPEGTALVYSTYLGGSKDDQPYALAIDTAGNAYITGFTKSSDFPTTPGAYNTTYGWWDWNDFLSKLNPEGSALIYSTYISGASSIYGIAVDNDMHAYVTGYTDNYVPYPITSGAFDSTFNGGHDVVVTKFNAEGSGLMYSTLFGGEEYDMGYGIAIDSAGNAYITGMSSSYSGFPTTPGAFDTTNRAVDCFITKVNPDGTDLVYSTLLGGNIRDFGYGITIDNTGNAYVTGFTQSPDFPTTAGAVDQTFNGGYYDAFMTEVNSTGTKLVYSTFLGGSWGDEGYGIAVDKVGNIFITGRTESSDFPTMAKSFDPIYNGSGDAFVTKLSPFPCMNSYGHFTVSSDTQYWSYESYGDSIVPGGLWVDTRFDGFAVVYQTPGQKGKLTQTFAVPSSGWYTAKARVWTANNGSPANHQKIYLCLQELNNANEIVSAGNQVIQYGSGYFDADWAPQEMEISFYAQGTNLAAQLVCINPSYSGITGSLCIDYIWVYAGVPQVTDAIALANPSFDSGTTDWLVQNYADGT
ncbi:MAG: SBBP repeat-containing protein, partial [bacterium]